MRLPELYQHCFLFEKVQINFISGDCEKVQKRLMLCGFRQLYQISVCVYAREACKVEKVETR